MLWICPIKQADGGLTMRLRIACLLLRLARRQEHVAVVGALAVAERWMSYINVGRISNFSQVRCGETYGTEPLCSPKNA